MKEINVIGTMQLLAACQKAPSVQRLVVKSSAAVYGSSPRDPAMFTEDMGPKALPRSGFGKDSVEVEGYVRGFARRRPDVEVTMLRFANIIGPGIQHRLTDYFALPVVPVPFGFDARLQFVHEDDALEALRLATTGQPGGIVNVAGDGVITVQQAARLAGRPIGARSRWRPPGCSAQFVRRAGLADFSAGADAVPRLRPGRGHHPDARGAAASSRGSRPARRSTTSSPRPAPACRARPSSAASSTASPARPPASSPTRCHRDGAPDGRSRRRADPAAVPARGQGRARGPAPDALAAGAARASGERARRRRTPLISDAAAGDPRRRRRPLPDDRAAGAPRRSAGGARSDAEPAPAGTPVGGRDQDAALGAPAAGRRRAPQAARLGKAASAGSASEHPLGRAPAGRAAQPSGRCAPPEPATGPDRGREPTAASPVRRRPATAAGSRVSGLEDARRTSRSSLLRLAAEASGLSGQDVERQVAEHPGLPAPPADRRLRGRRLRLRRGLHRARLLPLLRPLYQHWFRVEIRGIENIPAEGGALVVANHSGTIALDALMTQVAVHDEHPDAPAPADARRRPGLPDAVPRRRRPQERHDPGLQRRRRAAARVRASWSGSGPEGFKGVGKPFSERYKLQRFGRGGFVAAALRTGVPIIPCSIVGAEEIYPMIGNIKTLARLLGAAVLPDHADVPAARAARADPAAEQVDHRVRRADRRPPTLGPGAADDPMLVFNLTDQVRETIQQTLYRC